MTFTIRPATVNDVAAIRAMHAQSWRDTYPNEEAGVAQQFIDDVTASWMTPDALAYSRSFLSAVFDDPSQFYRVALDGNDVPGPLLVDRHHQTPRCTSPTRCEHLR